MDQHDLTVADTQPAAPRPTYTGDVAITPIAHDDGLGMRCSSVRFWPGARTGWHHHKGSQVLIVIDGAGLIANAEGTVVHAHPGVVVTVESGESHWHGATANHAMTHVAITLGESTYERTVDDREYQAAQQ